MPGLSRIRAGLLMLGLSASLAACESARNVAEIMAGYDDPSQGANIRVEWRTRRASAYIELIRSAAPPTGRHATRARPE